jgi:L-asparaginase / beta-aspartyl-peptidase
MAFEADEYCPTKERIIERAETQKEPAFGPVHSQTNESWLAAAAWDKCDDLAAATSTGGMVNQRRGRVWKRSARWRASGHD